MVILVFISTMLTTVAFAKNLITEHDGVKLNWSHLVIQFQGNAPSGPKSYSELEQLAWNQGLLAIKNQIQPIRQMHWPNESDESAGNIATLIARSTYSTNTTYYQNGGIEIQLANSLARVFRRNDLDFSFTAMPNLSAQSNSSIILRLSEKMEPQPIYQIVDNDNSEVYSVAKIAQAAYERNLMGRWYVSKASPNYIGTNPITIGVRPENGRLVVNRKEWDSATANNELLLRSAKIAIVLP